MALAVAGDVGEPSASFLIDGVRGRWKISNRDVRPGWGKFPTVASSRGFREPASQFHVLEKAGSPGDYWTSWLRLKIGSRMASTISSTTEPMVRIRIGSNRLISAAISVSSSRS